tara:strand:+ start:6865 stop:8505 length:1641 start_codon:yes stop_codon:yes gene_type:complete
MATFKAFKPEAMQRIARSMGHTGDMNQFENFLMANPEKSNMMQNYNAKAMQMAEGGVVKKMQEGGDVEKETNPDDPPATDTPATDENTQSIMDYTGDQITNPVAPIGGTVDAEKIEVKDDQTVDEGTGQVGDAPKVETKTGDTKEITETPKVEAETIDPTKVGDAPKIDAVTTEITPEMLVKAAQGKMSPEEAQAYVDALKAGQATVTKEATVQGQLENLNAQAKDGQIPSYATAAVRSAMSAMAARGLGASSMASGAVFNAILESQLPIAQADANTFAQYGLANATNAQQATLAKAAALSSLNLANLNNRQQAAVENSKRFLQVDLANLETKQQTAMFNAKAQQDFMLSDQAADNAAKQFNATSKMQTDQFMANLSKSIAEFNASQQNAMTQFNTGELNSTAKFNAQMQNQRDQFNAQNKLVIEQFNAQWRQNVATTDTAATNQANQFNATALLGISNTAYTNMWSHMSDMMEWAWTSGENEQDRITELSIAEINAKIEKYKADLNLSATQSAGLGKLFGEILTNPLAGSLLGGVFNIPYPPSGE